MQPIILCEGKTDAILISYILIKRYGWAFSPQQSQRNPAFKYDHKSEVYKIYTHEQKPQRELIIWGGKGISDLPRKLSKVAERNRSETEDSSRYSHIVVFFDRDTRSDPDCQALIQNMLAGSRITVAGDVTPGEWKKGTILLPSTPREEYSLELLFIVLPPDRKGALETFLLSCLERMSPPDQELVQKALGFINLIPDAPYLLKPRYRPKAQLGAVLSVISPDWVFSEIDNRLHQVDWNQIQAVTTVYEPLEKL